MGHLAQTIAPKPARCKVGAILDEYADAEDLETFNNPNVTTADLAEFISENWGFVGRTAVSAHRREACACYRRDRAA